MTRFRTALAIFLLGTACGGGSSPQAPSSQSPSPSGQTSILRDLQYTSRPRSLRLDLHLPTSTLPAPVIVYLHGSDGSKEGGGQASLVFAQRSRGYAVAAIDYSGPDGRFPASVQDGKAAIRWLRANAAAHNVNPARIGVWGTSYGAYVAGLLGTTEGEAALEDLAQGAPSESSGVQAVVGWAGFYDLVGLGAEDWLVSLLGCAPQQCPDRAAEASPVTYVDGGDPPFLLVHGQRDDIVNEGFSRQMHERLQAAGAPSTLLVVPGLGHGGSGWSAREVMEPTEAFLDRHLR